MTLQQALTAAIGELRAAGIEDPAVDARKLLAFVMGCDAGRLILMMHDGISEDQQASYEALITRRAERVPVSHLIGGRDFYGRRFKVTSDVLDPRPETETLIELALAEPFDTLLDLGTGSGCIALTLLAERANAKGIALDLSDAALAIARENATSLGLAERVDLRQSDWFSSVEGRFDLIVSNPPYIDAAEIPELSPEVRLHEPAMALSPGEDGTAPYRILAAGAMRHLQPRGRILVEIGHRQGPAVVAIFQEAGLVDVRVNLDLDGRDRVISARNPQK